jgi:hypothetical protein
MSRAVLLKKIDVVAGVTSAELTRRMAALEHEIARPVIMSDPWRCPLVPRVCGHAV